MAVCFYSCFVFVFCCFYFVFVFFGYITDDIIQVSAKQVYLLNALLLEGTTRNSMINELKGKRVHN